MFGKHKGQTSAGAGNAPHERFLSFSEFTHGIWADSEKVLDQAQMALWEWTPHNGVVRGSRQLAEIIGMEPDSEGRYLSDAIRERIHPVHRQYMDQVIRDAARGETFETVKCRIVRPDGEERWIVLRRISCDADVQTGILMDVTRNQRVEIKLSEDLNYLQSMVDGIPIPVFCKGSDGRYEFCNDAFARMLGARKEHVVGLTVYDIEPPELARIYHEKDMELIRDGDVQEYEAKVRTHTGEYRDFRFNKAALRNSRGVVKGMVGAMTDITELKRAHTRNQRLLKMKEAMLEVSQAVMGMNDRNNLMQLILAKALGAIEKSNVGSVLIQKDDGCFHGIQSYGYQPEADDDFRLKIKDSFIYKVSGGDYTEPVIINDIPGLVRDGCPLILATDSGRNICSSISTPVQIEGEPLLLVNIDSFEDQAFDQDDVDLMRYLKVAAEMALANLKLYQETLRLSQYDQMTQVYNRSHFEKVLKAVLSHGQGDEHGFVYVVADMDQTQITNGRFGNAVGDRMICSLARGIESLLNEDDLLGRTGGDEFSAVFFGREPQQVEESLSRLALRVPIPDEPGGDSAGIAFSFGTARFPQDGSSYDELARTAIRNLLLAKNKKNKKQGD